MVSWRALCQVDAGDVYPRWQAVRTPHQCASQLTPDLTLVGFACFVEHVCCAFIWHALCACFVEVVFDVCYVGVVPSLGMGIVPPVLTVARVHGHGAEGGGGRGREEGKRETPLMHDCNHMTMLTLLSCCRGMTQAARRLPAVSDHNLHGMILWPSPGCNAGHFQHPLGVCHAAALSRP